MANPYVAQTWTDGVSQTTAARMAVIEQGIVDAHFAPGARVFHSVNQSILNITRTALAFDSERNDAAGSHNTAVNNSRLTCQVAGHYIVGAHVVFAANATGRRDVSLRLDGTDIFAPQSQMAVTDATANTAISVASEVELAVNQYVEVTVFQASGGALNVLAAAPQSPEFWFRRIG